MSSTPLDGGSVGSQLCNSCCTMAISTGDCSAITATYVQFATSRATGRICIRNPLTDTGQLSSFFLLSRLLQTLRPFVFSWLSADYLVQLSHAFVPLPAYMSNMCMVGWERVQRYTAPALFFVAPSFGETIIDNPKPGGISNSTPGAREQATKP